MDGPSYQDLMRELEREIANDKPRPKRWRRILRRPRTITGKLLPVILGLVIVSSVGLAAFNLSYISAPHSTPQTVYPILLTTDATTELSAGANVSFYVRLNNTGPSNLSAVLVVVSGSCTPDPSSPAMSVIIGETDGGTPPIFQGDKFDLCSGGQMQSKAYPLPAHVVEDWSFFEDAAAGFGTITLTVQAAVPH